MCLLVICIFVSIVSKPCQLLTLNIQPHDPTDMTDIIRIDEWGDQSATLTRLGCQMHAHSAHANLIESKFPSWAVSVLVYKSFSECSNIQCFWFGVHAFNSYVLDVAPHKGGQIKCGPKGLQTVGLFKAPALNGICMYTYSYTSRVAMRLSVVLFPDSAVDAPSEAV